MNVSDSEYNYLKEQLAKDLIVMLMENRNMTKEEAFRTLYRSNIYGKLSNPETGLFFQSPGYLYSYLEEEL